MQSSPCKHKVNLTNRAPVKLIFQRKRKSENMSRYEKTSGQNNESNSYRGAQVKLAPLIELTQYRTINHKNWT